MSISFAGQSDSGEKHHIAVAFGASFGGAFSIIIIVGLIFWWRYRRNQQIFFDVNGEYILLELWSMTVYINLC